MIITKEELQQIFDSRVEALVAKDYPAHAGMTEVAFREMLAPLREKLEGSTLSRERNIPLVIVVRGRMVSAEAAMKTVVANGLEGEVRMTPKQPEDFTDLESLDIPPGDVYVLLDIDTGQEFLNISPEECTKEIFARGRTPLTQDEGVSLAVQLPEILTDKANYNCIQMPGSRIEGDQRVPSIWLSYRRPRLGWCWDRNIHTWLGTASAGQRIGLR